MTFKENDYIVLLFLFLFLSFLAGDLYYKINMRNTMCRTIYGDAWHSEFIQPMCTDGHEQRPLKISIMNLPAGDIIMPDMSSIDIMDIDTHTP